MQPEEDQNKSDIPQVNTQPQVTVGSFSESPAPVTPVATSSSGEVNSKPTIPAIDNGKDIKLQKFPKKLRVVGLVIVVALIVIALVLVLVKHNSTPNKLVSAIKNESGIPHLVYVNPSTGTLTLANSSNSPIHSVPWANFKNPNTSISSGAMPVPVTGGLNPYGNEVPYSPYQDQLYMLPSSAGGNLIWGNKLVTSSGSTVSLNGSFNKVQTDGIGNAKDYYALVNSNNYVYSSCSYTNFSEPNQSHGNPVITNAPINCKLYDVSISPNKTTTLLSVNFPKCNAQTLNTNNIACEGTPVLPLQVSSSGQTFYFQSGNTANFFSQYSYGIYSYNLTNNKIQPLFQEGSNATGSITNYVTSPVVLSLNGTEAVFTDNGNTLDISNLQSNPSTLEAVNIPGSSATGYYGCEWSPDSTKLLIREYTEANSSSNSEGSTYLYYDLTTKRLAPIKTVPLSKDQYLGNIFWLDNMHAIYDVDTITGTNTVGSSGEVTSPYLYQSSQIYEYNLATGQSTPIPNVPKASDLEDVIY